MNTTLLNSAASVAKTPSTDWIFPLSQSSEASSVVELRSGEVEDPRSCKHLAAANNPRFTSEESSQPHKPLQSSASISSILSPKPSLEHPGKKMSDSLQLSSPSTSKASSSSSPNSRSGSGSSDEPYLSMSQQPPKYAYSNENFDITVQLETPSSAVDTPPRSSLEQRKEIELMTSLVDEHSGNEAGPEAILVTQPSRITLLAGEDGIFRCRVSCLIRIDGIRRDQGAAFAIKFRVRPESTTSSHSPLAAGIPPATAMAVTTTSVNVVNYKIRITLEDDWGPVWYKDEGGRDKSMEIYAAIFDKDGQLRTGEQIPLQTTLCYEPSSRGGEKVRVSNQDILRTLGTSKIVIDKDTGRARIRFRVEDVSKNHQAQDFVLQVGPDPKSKSFKDIAPDCTPPVNVRSKRNKRSRATSHGRTSSDLSKRLSPAGAVARSYEPQHDSGSVIDQGDTHRVREALRSVIHWADEVVNGLFPLQWQVLGYAQHPDGTTDYHRPYHNMPNPNPCINRVLGLYSDTVRDSLQIISNAVEQADPGRSDDPTSILPIPIAVPRPSPGADDSMYGSMMRGPPQSGPMSMPLPRRGMMGPQGMHDFGMPMYGGGPNMGPPSHMMPPQPQGMPSMHPYMRGVPENDMMPMPLPSTGGGDMMQQQRSIRPEEESRESEVEYVLAKQYKALRTGERLGFPAYSANKEILGFYREQAGSAGRQFSPIARHRNDFGPLEIMQATEILEDAIKKKSEAVHSLKTWGSIENLLNQVLVYDWRQDIAHEPQGSPT